MPIGLLFWIIMAVWIVSRVTFAWRGPAAGPYGPYMVVGSDIMILVLLFLLGWHDFGFIIQRS